MKPKEVVARAIYNTVHNDLYSNRRQPCDGYCAPGECVCPVEEEEVVEVDVLKTEGLRCKACDCALSAVEFDGELCETCLTVVNEMNQDLHSKMEEQIDEVVSKLEQKRTS